MLQLSNKLGFIKSRLHIVSHFVESCLLLYWIGVFILFIWGIFHRAISDGLIGVASDKVYFYYLIGLFISAIGLIRGFFYFLLHNATPSLAALLIVLIGPSILIVRYDSDMKYVMLLFVVFIMHLVTFSLNFFRHPR